MIIAWGFAHIHLCCYFMTCAAVDERIRQHGSCSTNRHSVSLSQLASSFSGESALPPNLLLPTNLVDPSRLSKSEPTSLDLIHMYRSQLFYVAAVVVKLTCCRSKKKVSQTTDSSLLRISLFIPLFIIWKLSVADCSLLLQSVLLLLQTAPCPSWGSVMPSFPLIWAPSTRGWRPWRVWTASRWVWLSSTRMSLRCLRGKDELTFSNASIWKLSSLIVHQLWCLGTKFISLK